jgi:hypothetical protein
MKTKHISVIIYEKHRYRSLVDDCNDVDMTPCETCLLVIDT